MMADVLIRSKLNWNEAYLEYFEGDVADMAHEMATKLADNHHKGGWDGLDPMWAFKRIVDEASELIEAVLQGKSPEEVGKEAADVANFALIMWKAYEQKHNKER